MDHSALASPQSKKITSLSLYFSIHLGSGVPMSPKVPDNWPVVPIIAINKNPLFPKFHKIVEVTDERLIPVLRQKVRLNHPYAGLFVKKDDENTSEVVKHPDDVYPIGSFVQIVEMQDLGENKNLQYFNFPMLRYKIGKKKIFY